MFTLFLEITKDGQLIFIYSVPFDHTNTQKNFEDMFSYSLECASMCVLPKNLNNDLFHVSDSWQWQCVK